MHKEWVQTAARVLGISCAIDHKPHYVENCVVWSTAALRGMIGHIEKQHARPWHQMLLAEKSFSEYYLYGLYLDCVADLTKVAPTSVSLCHSYWPAPGMGPIDVATLLTKASPESCALAIQSTDPLRLSERTRLFEMANKR